MNKDHWCYVVFWICIAIVLVVWSVCNMKVKKHQALVDANYVQVSTPTYHHTIWQKVGDE